MPSSEPIYFNNYNNFLMVTTGKLHFIVEESYNITMYFESHYADFLTYIIINILNVLIFYI